MQRTPHSEYISFRSPYRVGAVMVLVTGFGWTYYDSRILGCFKGRAMISEPDLGGTGKAAVVLFYGARVVKAHKYRLPMIY